MKLNRLGLILVAGTAVAAFAACNDAFAPILDSDLAADLASSAGDAIASDVNEAVLSEVFGGFAPASDIPAAPADDSVHNTFDATRTRTCYNASGTVLPACGSGTTSMKVTLVMNGSRTGPNFSGAVHRARTDSISGLGQNSTSRVHNARGTSNDSTSFTRDSTTRAFAESSADTVVALTFNLPRSSNPWPVSGQIIRNVNASVTFTGKITGTRSISRRVVVTFPADNQGNVSIQVGAMSCMLNLVTHKVTGCTGG